MDLTIRQVCEALQQSRPLVYRLLQTRKLRGYKIGVQGRTSHWRVPVDALEDYRRSQR